MLDSVHVIGIMDGGAGNNRVLAVAVPVDGHQRRVWCVDVKPFRKQKVDLVYMLLERGVTGRVVCDVVGCAQPFAGVEGDLRGLALGLAPRGTLVPCSVLRG